MRSLPKKYETIIDLLNKNNILVICSFFFIIFIIFSLNLLNYGVSQDEYFSRTFGFINLNYIGNLIFPDFVSSIKKDKIIPELESFEHNFYSGAFFEAIISATELLFGIKEKKYQFILRHTFISSFFYISLIFYFKIFQKIFGNWMISLLGVLFLLLSPRIFAESFYNNKDIFFMSSCIIVTFFFTKYFQENTWKNAIFFSFFVSLTITSRVMGVLLPIIFLFLYIFLKYKSKKNLELFYEIIIPIIFSILFTYLMWPYLWSNPIENFLNSFEMMKQYEHGGYNLYFGNKVLSNNVPWHYSLVWISITTPVIFLFLSFIGLLSLKVSILKNEKRNDFFYIIFITSILIISITLFSIIILNSTLYNGWRHIYFIYPYILFLAIFGFNFILKIISNKTLKFVFILLIFFNLSNIIYWMIKNNPHQYIYFNIIGKKLDITNFDLDYWGLSYYQNLKSLSEKDKSDKLKIFNTSETKIFYSLFSLKNEIRSRFVEVKNINEADYVITNYYLDEIVNSEKFQNNFNEIQSIVIDNIKINSIFKKKIN